MKKGNWGENGRKWVKKRNCGGGGTILESGSKELQLKERNEVPFLVTKCALVCHRHIAITIIIIVAVLKIITIIVVVVVLTIITITVFVTRELCRVVHQGCLAECHTVTSPVDEIISLPFIFILYYNQDDDKNVIFGMVEFSLRTITVCAYNNLNNISYVFTK